VRIPVAEKAKPRRVQINVGDHRDTSINAHAEPAKV
jgi:hypothetical protein